MVMTTPPDAVPDAEPGPADALADPVETYPDAHSAHAGLANDGWMLANQYAEALPHARAATAAQYVDRARAQYLEGMLLLGMDRYPEAIRAYVIKRANEDKALGGT